MAEGFYRLRQERQEGLAGRLQIGNGTIRALYVALRETGYSQSSLTELKDGTFLLKTAPTLGEIEWNAIKAGNYRITELGPAEYSQWLEERMVRPRNELHFLDGGH